jgi:hypothetical protein
MHSGLNMSTFRRVWQIGRDPRPRHDKEEWVCGGTRPSGSAPGIHRVQQFIGDSSKAEHILELGHAYERTTDGHSRRPAC